MSLTGWIIDPFGPGQGPARDEPFELFGGPGDGVVSRMRYRGATPHEHLELPWPDEAGRLEVHRYRLGNLMIRDLAEGGGCWRYCYVGASRRGE